MRLIAMFLMQFLLKLSIFTKLELNQCQKHLKSGYPHLIWVGTN